MKRAEQNVVFSTTGTKACAKVEDLITSTRLCNDMRKLSTGAQTSDLEAFHSVVNHFAPKQYSFKYYGQLCRLVELHAKYLI